MAIFTAIAAGAKILAKKVGKGALKKKAKNFVQGKKDEKKDKRQVAKNIMQKESVYAGGGAIVPKVEPVSSLVPSGGDKGGALATIDKGDSGKTSFSSLTKTLDNIVGLTDGIATVSSGLAKQKEDELKALDLKKKEQEAKAREAKLEKKTGLLGGVGDKVKKAAKNPLDAMIKFVVNIALGALVLFLVNNADKIKKSFEFITKNWDKMMWVFRAALLEITSGFPLLKSSLGLLKKGAGKALKLIAVPFKAFGNLIKNGFAKMGSRILNWAKGGIGAITKGIGNAAKAVASPLINVASKGINAAQKGITAAKTAVSNTASKAKDFVTGKVNKVKDVAKAKAQKVVSKVANKSKPILDKASKIAAKGQKVAGKAQKIAAKANKPIKGGLKFIQKLMGPKAAQGLANNASAMKPLAKASKGIKIPIIGPLLVAITSMLAGDPLGQTLFKALGAALGGALGSLVPIPVVGTILGEMIGEFAGDLLYEGFMGKGWGAAGQKLKKKLLGILSGGKAVLKWIGGGFSRFFKGFMDTHKINIPKGKGVQTVLGKILPFLANKDGLVTSIPNILQLYNPMAMGPLLLKSFFPPGEKNGEGSAKVSSSSTPAEIAASPKDADAAAVSEETDYEKTGGNTVIVEDPTATAPSGGGGGGSKTVVLAASTKDVVNSYNKSVVTGQLSKI